MKNKKGIELRYRSCCNAISKYNSVFYAYVPAKFIQQILQQAHADPVFGLSVSAMPMATSAMDIGDKCRPYQVLLLKNDGASEVYVADN
ncbi:hypothetical protein CXF80_04240 [Shewanella sp. Actino-trap-3]|nr:hypothetical protein CXF80_04240 [Shewanella sp. Actino-trap-3]